MLTVYVEGVPDPHLGWIADFAHIKKIVSSVVDILDHKLLNNIDGLENPTCELLAMWLWNKIKPSLPALNKIALNETPTSGVIYEGM